MFIHNLVPYKITINSTIREAAYQINNNAHGIAVVVDEQNRVIATITDGDLRSAVLRNISFDNPIDILIKDQKSLPYSTPILASVDFTVEELLRIMRHYNIRHVPIVDAQRYFLDLAILEELVSFEERSLQALVMAGGYGKRLLPLTEKLPKPMLPLNGRPILEYIIQRLSFFGVKNIIISTHYLKDKIIEYFGDGSRFDVNIEYTVEEKPSGTGGALKLMNKEVTTLIINGDILTDLNFRLFYNFHVNNQAWMTVGVKQHEVEIPYGVVDLNGIDIDRLIEKPKLFYYINAGIYLVDPVVFQNLPDQDNIDIPDIIRRFLEAKKRVISFPIYGYWNDIGSPTDYEQAQRDILNLFGKETL